MKKNWWKKVLAVTLAAAMTVGTFTGCGEEKGKQNTKGEEETEKEDVSKKEEGTAKGGTIMWLSNLTSGLQYETTVAYLTAICEELGYDFKVVYGDGYNDAAGNLAAVKNGMTSDVVGILTSQDGGLLSIMEEFPDVYVAGFNTDMVSVYGEGGENAAVLEKDHFLGTICDGYGDGADTAQTFMDTVVEKGYKKVAVIDFPAYAYPALSEASHTFVELVDEYNGTVSEEEQIEIVGDITTLEFTPLADSWFLEEGHDELDCIVGACAGILFIYPTLSAAISNGFCSPDTKLITGSFDDDETIVSQIGGDGIISMVTFSPAEDPAFALILMDNAIQGCQYEDFTNARVDGYPYVIDSKEDIDNVMTKSMAGTGDVSLAQISVEEIVNLCKRNNPEATYEQLMEVFHDPEIVSVDALADK